MPIVSVIKYEGDNSTFVWKYPETDFNTSSQLIVHESQEALFMVNGEILDTFGAGKYELETQNLPVAKSLFKLGTGGQNAFHSELYFVNLVDVMSVKWGTDSRIQYMEPVYKFPVDIGACGEMSLSVSNARKLLVKIVGTEHVLTKQQLSTYFRAFLMNRIKAILPSVIKEKAIDIFSIDQHLMELSEAIEEKLRDDFFDYGVSLKRFLITTVVKPEDNVNYIRFKEIHYRNYTDVAEAELNKKLARIEQETKAQNIVIEAEAIARKRELEGYTYQQERGFDVAKDMANNDSVAQMNNVGIGLGMMAGIGGELGRNVSSMATGAMVEAAKQTSANMSGQMEKSVVKRFCMNCGHELNGNAMFCEMCGTKVETGKDTCLKCGYSFSNDARFCPVCGTKRGENA
jgi:virion core protein (lumpy skin disease virus) family protein